MEKKNTIWKIIKNYLNRNLFTVIHVTKLFEEIEKEYGTNYTRAGVYRNLLDLERHKFIQCISKKRGRYYSMQIFPYNVIPEGLTSGELRAPFFEKQLAPPLPTTPLAQCPPPTVRKTWKQKINLFLKFFSWKNNSLGSV